MVGKSDRSLTINTIRIVQCFDSSGTECGRKSAENSQSPANLTTLCRGHVVWLFPTVLVKTCFYGFLDNTDPPDTNYLRGYQLLLFGDALTAINRLFRPRSVLGNTDEQHQEIPADL